MKMNCNGFMVLVALPVEPQPFRFYRFMRKNVWKSIIQETRLMIRQAISPSNGQRRSDEESILYAPVVTGSCVLLYASE